MKKKMYMIGNAHLDPVWLWRWQEGYAENRATMHSLLARLEEYEDVVITSSSAQLYEWIEENDLEMFQKIRDQIREKRLIVCGGWWVQPDCNIPSGESFARQSLISQNYFYEKLGVISRVGYCVDSFGHNGMLPQILKLSRMDSYVFMRPSKTENPMPDHLFEWESPDGSRVTAFRIPGSYCAYDGLMEQMDDCIREVLETESDIMCFFGVGNHGGGPTIENIEMVKKKQQDCKEVEILFSSPLEYFKDMQKRSLQMPIVTGDLQHHASGCYSLHSKIKRQNRKAENELLAAEKYEVLAEVILKARILTEGMEKAWKGVLFNQFHDILAGTSIRRACEDALLVYGEARSIAMRTANQSIQAISSKIDILHRPGCIPVVVFNPLAWQVCAPIELEFGAFLNCRLPKYMRVLDYKKQEVAFQQIKPEAYCKDRTRIVFEPELPAMGYGVFWIEERDAAKEKIPPCLTPENILENEHLRVKINEETGGITSYYDKKLKIELIRDTAAIGTVFKDESDAWSHAVFSFEEKAGNFELVSVEKTEAGSMREVIRAVSRYQQSELIQEFILYKSKARLEVKVKVNWQNQAACLKLEFPLCIAHTKAIYETPYGFIEKEANGLEEPMQNYFLAEGIHKSSKEKAGMLIWNDGKYSGSVSPGKISMTVLRSPAFAHHHPYNLDSSVDGFSFVDQGWQEFEYAVAAFEGAWTQTDAVRIGMEFNQRPDSMVESFHPGILPDTYSLFEVAPANVVASCCKRAYREEGWIIRCYEAKGLETMATLRIAGQQYEIRFGKHQIRTFKISADTWEIKELDLLEWEIEHE